MIGHIRDRVVWPELTWDVSNWQPEHRACSDASGQDAVIRKAKADALRAAGITDPGVLARYLDDTSSQVGPVFPGAGGSRKPPPLSISLPGDERPDPLALDEIRPELRWEAFWRDAPGYALPIVEIPADSAPPLAMTPPHPRAAGSYGLEVIKEIEQTDGRPLRWWQKLVLIRMLEHDSEGVLCWRYVLFSGPRRVGKSHVSRGLMTWRLRRGRELFGERQVIVHTAMDLYVCRVVQRPAWTWAARYGWDVVKANGKESINAGEDTWVIKSAAAAGHADDVTTGFVDEAWDVSPVFVDDGIIPAMTDRLSPQLVLTSTANRRATSLMRTNIAAALAEDDGETLLMLWAAPADADVGDLEVWRASSPHWSNDREAAMRKMYAKALAGEADPELDDPDPMMGFRSQWLNQWRLGERREDKGEPIVTRETWAELGVIPPARRPDAIAIEGWGEAGVTVVSAWQLDVRQSVVSAEDHPNIDAAVLAARASGFRGRLVVGKSLAESPAVRRRPHEPATGRAGAAAADLATLIRDDRLRHDGGEHLAAAALGARVVETADGVRLLPGVRGDVLKAVVWAVDAAATRGARGSGRVITARG